RAATSFLYQAIYKARGEMVKRFQKRKKVANSYLKILDTRRDSQFRKNLHAAKFEKHRQTSFDLLGIIEKYAYGDPDLNYKLTSEMRIFKNIEQNFERLSGIYERSTDVP
ncbi:hypothetical protein S83_019034, partial [Arachis hypogaea]